MANKNIITTAAKTVQVENNFYSPSAVLPTNLAKPLSSIYCFLAKVDPWPAEEDPPLPTQDTFSIKKIFKNTFVVKHITSNDISPVIKRINWESGETYTPYSDTIDILAKDENGFPLYYFYVKNRYDQVFKCLWNNNNQPSTVEPYFEPGTYNTNNMFEGADGYKWKFIYTIDTGLKIKFMDSTWIPITIGTNSVPNPLRNDAGFGNIDAINVTNGGSNYDPANSAITVTVTGDGTGAKGTASVTNGAITDIVVTNRGSNYTYANVQITSASGSGAVAIAPTSPVGGHGFDPISELGCTHVMMTAEFNGEENGNIPVDIDYRQIGLLINPTTRESSPNPANGNIYKTTTDFVLASGQGVYLPDETIYQYDSEQNVIFSATVLSYDSVNNILKLINTTGTYVLNSTVFGNTSQTARTLLTVSLPNFVLYSGHIVFVENRSGVQRSTDGIEQFKFVLGY